MPATSHNPLATPPPRMLTGNDDDGMEESTPHISNVTTHRGGSSDSDNHQSNNRTSQIAPNAEQQSSDTATAAASKQKLYESTRLKGYITLILASVINYSAARRSGRAVNSNAVASSDTQRVYAEAVSLMSCIISLVAFVAHLDRYSPLQSLWQSAFGDGSLFELFLILFLVLWWGTATVIETTVRGIAGDGKAQYNLYYSTWGCCWTCIWTLERWLVAYGWASFKAFISSWPFRAPGWIAIGGTSFLTLMWYLDLHSHHEDSAVETAGLYQHYQDVGDGQWQWMLFVGTFSLIPSLIFVVVELFRETSTVDVATTGSARGRTSPHPTPTPRHLSFSVSARSPNSSEHDTVIAPNTAGSSLRQSRVFLPQRQNPLQHKNNTRTSGGKGQLENVLEGFCLVLLVLAWIPTVIVVTTPGGAASLVGNAYFFTWINTVFVMETFIWYVHDLRKGVHSALQAKEREYQRRQQEVLQRSRALEGKRQREGDIRQFLEDDLSLDINDERTLMTRTASKPVAPARPIQRMSRPPVFDGEEIMEDRTEHQDVSGDGNSRRTNRSSDINRDHDHNVDTDDEDDEIARALEEDMQRPDLIDNGLNVAIDDDDDDDGPTTPMAGNTTNPKELMSSPTGSSLFYDAMGAPTTPMAGNTTNPKELMSSPTGSSLFYDAMGASGKDDLEADDENVIG